jgi:hypothetical protein
VGGGDLSETGFGAGAIRRVEDGADVGGDLTACVEAVGVSLGVLLEVELAALPRGGVEGGAQGGAETFVGIGGDEIRDADAALLEGREAGAPVGFGFGDGGRDAQDEAVGVVAADADGGENGAVADRPLEAGFDGGGVEDEEGDFGQGRDRHFSNSASSSAVRRETWVEEISSPQSSLRTASTRRVETPWRYISAMAALRARSTREPLSRSEVRKGSGVERVWGTRRLSLPIGVERERCLKPLAWPRCCSPRS